ncbi:hypothetical protein D0B88_01125 [Cellvibrio sp. KY-YJ-3]|nr:hypothetical protein D0B88_01125 [Cellvibrio sp. KY-YJ-3]
MGRQEGDLAGSRVTPKLRGICSHLAEWQFSQDNQQSQEIRYLFVHFLTSPTSSGEDFPNRLRLLTVFGAAVSLADHKRYS